MEKSHALLRRMAAKYVWWKPPGEACDWPDRVVAQVMSFGEFEDVQAVATELGDAALRHVVLNAEPGMFDERSWHYWHYRLGLANVGSVPAMPVRVFA